VDLKTLEGAPQKVGGSFDCKGCTGLKTLEGAPQKVGGSFDCKGCTGLKTLEGAPQEVGIRLDFADCTGLLQWVHDLLKEYEKKEIMWKELLQTHEKFLKRPNLVKAKNLGLF
jgi:hypothetical protein